MAIKLSSLQKNVAKPPIITLIGGPGIGKTTFGANSEKPVFIICEDGLGILDVDHFPICTSFEQIIECLDALYTENHEFKTLVIDTLDHLEPIIWQKVCDDNKIQTIEKLPYGKGYVEAFNYWRALFEGIRAIRDDKKMNIIMIAHSQIVRIEDPMQAAYDTHTLKLHKKASALAEEISDIILFADQKTHTITEDAGFNQKRTRAVTTGVRVIYTEGAPSYTAKNRYHLPPELPLDWAAFDAAMKKSLERQQTN